MNGYTNIDYSTQTRVINDTSSRIKHFTNADKSKVGEYLEILRLKINQLLEMKPTLKKVDSSNLGYRSVLGEIFYYGIIVLTLHRAGRKDWDQNNKYRTNDIEIEMYQMLIIFITSDRKIYTETLKKLLYEHRTFKETREFLTEIKK